MANTGRESVEQINLSFGLEDIGEGNTEILEGLLADDTDPDEVEEIDEEEEKRKKLAAQKRAAQKKPALPPKKATPPAEEAEEEEEEDGNLADEFEEDELPRPPKKKTEAAASTPEDQADEAEDGEEEDEDYNQFEVLSKELFRLGIFSLDEDEEGQPEIKSAEQFLQQFELEKKRGATQVIDQFLSRYGQDYREAFQAIFIDGVTPEDYLQKRVQITSFKDMKLEGPENEANQELVVRRALQSQGFEPEDVDAEVERLKNYGDLETTSKRFHKVMLKREEAELQGLSQKKAAERQQEIEREDAYAKSVQRILGEKLKTRSFDGIPVTPQEAREAADYMVTKRYQTAKGEKLSEFEKDLLDLKRPENHELQVKLAMLLRKKLDLSQIKKGAVSAESSELFSGLRRSASKNPANQTPEGKKKTKVSHISSWFND
jgi:hypothetical protein